MKNLIKTQANLAKFIIAAGSFAIGGTALAQPATAAATTPASTVAYPVGYSDLDISAAKGAKTLYLRIRYAAEAVCESAATLGKKEGQACVNKAVTDAVARINAPQLTEYTQLHSKGDKVVLVQLANAK
jgi:UrcA family protein